MNDRTDALDFDMMPRQEPTAPRWTWWTRPRLVVLITVIGLLLRLWAAWQLPSDADEPVYLRAAHDYARLIDQGNLQGVIDYPENQEHPPLMKILYSGVLLILGSEAAIDPALFFSRLVSVIFGTLAVLVASLIDPLGGFFLAVQTLVVKYTSEVYLEALPTFAILWVVYALLKSKRPGDRWFWLSAAGLGLAGAGKFSYFPILLPVLYILIWDKRTPWLKLLFYLLVAGMVFFALNPAIWIEPAERLAGALTFHTSYSQSQHVQASGYHWYQPFLWVSTSWGYEWHPQVFLYRGIDEVIAVLGVIGLVMEWKKRRWLAVWIASSMLFLVLWPTRWPQYTLVVLPAFCLAAPAAFRRMWAWIMRQEYTWGWFSAMIPHPPRGVKIGLAVGGVVLIVLYMTYYIWLGAQRMGWSHLTAVTSSLPSNTVYDIEALPDGRMVVATSNGAAIWSPPQDDELVYTWEVFLPEESGLTDAGVLAVELSPEGELWFGTLTGIEIYDMQGKEWRLEQLPFQVQVNDIAFGTDGQVWAATSDGLLASDGSNWEVWTPAEQSGEQVFAFSVAVQPSAGGDIIWSGWGKGITRLDADTMEYQYFENIDAGLSTGGISQVIVDSKDRVWVSSLGGGVAAWDGTGWLTYRLDNSDLPGSVVRDVYEHPNGDIWVSVAFPNMAGGVTARLEGDDWSVFRSSTSGYTGAETLTMAADSQGRLWFGTVTRGIDIFEKAGD